MKSHAILVTMVHAVFGEGHTVVTEASSQRPRRAKPGDVFYFLHVPKCAGGSVSYELKTLIENTNSTFTGTEGCFRCAARSKTPTFDHFVTMVRSPRAQASLSKKPPMYLAVQKSGGNTLVNPFQGNSPPIVSCARFLLVVGGEPIFYAKALWRLVLD